MTLAVLPRHIQLTQELVHADGCRLERRRHTYCATEASITPPPSPQHHNHNNHHHTGEVSSQAASLAALKFAQSLELYRAHGNRREGLLTGWSTPQYIAIELDTSKDGGVDSNNNNNNVDRSAASTLPDEGGRPACTEESNDDRTTVAIAAGIERHAGRHCTADRCHSASFDGARRGRHHRRFPRSASLPCLRQGGLYGGDGTTAVYVCGHAHSNDGGTKLVTFRGGRVQEVVAEGRTSLSVPRVDGRRLVTSHEYTPYFYLPNRTSYANDQDVAIVDQCLEDVCLRANYFELKQLALAGFDFAKADTNGNTALHYAAVRGDAGIVRLLLGEGGSVWARNNDNKTPLEMASNLATAMLLVESTLFYVEKNTNGHLAKTTVCYEL